MGTEVAVLLAVTKSPDAIRSARLVHPGGAHRPSVATQPLYSGGERMCEIGGQRHRLNRCLPRTVIKLGRHQRVGQRLVVKTTPTGAGNRARLRVANVAALFPTSAMSPTPTSAMDPTARCLS
jgi:hypothetical protein